VQEFRTVTGEIKSLVDGTMRLHGRATGHRWGKGQVKFADDVLKLLRDTLAHLVPLQPRPC
jgi:hypothetical protein